MSTTPNAAPPLIKPSQAPNTLRALAKDKRTWAFVAALAAAAGLTSADELSTALSVIVNAIADSYP